MNKYSIAPHVADVRLHVQAESFENLLTVALDGMNIIMKKNYRMYLNRHSFIKEILINSNDQTSLLIDFLSKILTLSHIYKAIFHKIDRLEICENSLHAFVLGTKVNNFDEDIKAVTYHEAEIKRNKKVGLETTIVFDI